MREPETTCDFLLASYACESDSPRRPCRHGNDCHGSAMAMRRGGLTKAVRPTMKPTIGSFAALLGLVDSGNAARVFLSDAAAISPDHHRLVGLGLRERVSTRPAMKSMALTEESPAVRGAVVWRGLRAVVLVKQAS